MMEEKAGVKEQNSKKGFKKSLQCGGSFASLGPSFVFNCPSVF